MNGDEVKALQAKRICSDCVGEPYLSSEISSTGDFVPCSYCESGSKSIAIAELANRIDSAFNSHYSRMSDQLEGWQQSLMADRESKYEWERNGDPVIDSIANAALVEFEVAEDVQAILDDQYSDMEAAKVGEETEYAADSFYEEKSANKHGWDQAWRDLEESLKNKARFFNRDAASHLTSIFGGIDELRTKDGTPLVVEAGPDFPVTHFYRARVFQNRELLEQALERPDKHLAPPPAHLASAGRMNARGISVFYGATQPETAIAEVRPPVGSSVAVAKFLITRPLSLLDLTSLKKVTDTGSIFDPDFKSRLERVAFLNSLGQHMTRAVMPDDEAFDYLPTQAVADFLATENEPSFDGIIFESAQLQAGKNVVLFHKAARTAEISIPRGTHISASSGSYTDEGYEVDYRVTEEVPAPVATTSVEGNTARVGTPPWWEEHMSPPLRDAREEALRVDENSIHVHCIDWIQYQCTAHKVSRHRYQK